MYRIYLYLRLLVKKNISFKYPVTCLANFQQLSRQSQVKLESTLKKKYFKGTKKKMNNTGQLFVIWVQWSQKKVTHSPKLRNVLLLSIHQLSVNELNKHFKMRTAKVNLLSCPEPQLK